MVLEEGARRWAAVGRGRISVGPVNHVIQNIFNNLLSSHQSRKQCIGWIVKIIESLDRGQKCWNVIKCNVEMRVDHVISAERGSFEGGQKWSKAFASASYSNLEASECTTYYQKSLHLTQLPHVVSQFPGLPWGPNCTPRILWGRMRSLVIPRTLRLPS